MTPLDLGRDLGSPGLGGSAEPSTVIGLWTSGSDRGESWAAEEDWKASDRELERSIESEHQVGSG
jgi:hypothetical protein